MRTSSVQQGLIGCFRGLVVNGEILDIHSYMSVHLSEIIKDCKPFCQPNKCQNGARCVELWSNYKCVCENKWAHFGDYCENSKPIPISTTFDKFRDRNNSFRPLNSAFFFFFRYKKRGVEIYLAKCFPEEELLRHGRKGRRKISVEEYTDEKYPNQSENIRHLFLHFVRER